MGYLGLWLFGLMGMVGFVPAIGKGIRETL
jgi:hypothetical protein